MAFRSGNPSLNAKTFQNITRDSSNGVMTLNGTVNKVGILLTIVIVVAGLTMIFLPPTLLLPIMIVGALGGLIMALGTTFNKVKAPVTAPIYALFEGLFLGAVSSMYNSAYEGIVMQAIILTFGIFGSLLLVYKTGLIKPSENFKLGIAAATGGIAVFYVITLVMGLFGANTGFMHSSSLMSIGISAVIVIIAAMNLVLDFDFIEDACEMGLPKHMEWYGAFGLIVTLVWLYVEILRLLSKLRRR